MYNYVMLLQPKLEFQLRPHPDDEDVSNLIIRNLCTTPVTTGIVNIL